MSNLITELIGMRVYGLNKDFLSVVCGERRSGKSWVALFIVQELQKRNPNITVYVVFTAEEFKDAINKAKKGDVIIWDEAGVGYGNRKWMTETNIILGQILQTIGHENLCFLFTVPLFDFLDIQVRKMFCAYIEPMRIIFAERKTEIKYLWMQTNPLTGKTYTKYPKISRMGKKNKVKKITVPAPKRFKIRCDPKWFPRGVITTVEDYEKAAEKFKIEVKNKPFEKEEIKPKEKPKEPNIQCPTCGYRWVRSGKLDRVKCPNCGHNFKMG